MKKNLILIQTLLISGILFSQVGINTQNPQGILHVDGAKDNPTSGAPSATQQANDFIVTTSGNVGVGTTTPTRKLEIVSSTTPSFRLNDGSQQTGYYLMSDANGNGSWKSLTTSVFADLPATGYSGSVSTSSSDPKYTGISITLPPGKWLVLTNVVLRASTDPTGGNGAWVRLQWSRTQNTPSTTGITGSLNSGIYVAPYGNATGNTIIDNSSSTNSIFYLNLSGTDVYGSYSGNWNNLGSSTWTENSIVAYPAN